MIIMIIAVISGETVNFGTTVMSSLLYVIVSR